MNTTGPSDKAIVAATTRGGRWPTYSTAVLDIVNAAHDSALGLDRSVCLRDVAEALRAEARDLRDGYWDGVRYAADFIEWQFGGVR